MPLFGTSDRTELDKTGSFHCPSCDSLQPYRQKQTQRFLVVCFINVGRRGQPVTYVECQGCRGTYETDVLEQNEGSERDKVEAQFLSVMRRVMVDMMMADGDMDAQELETLKTIYQEIGRKPLSQDRLDAELRRLKNDGERRTVAYLRDEGSFLNEEGKLLVLKAALAVAAADGQFQAEEQILVSSYADALNVRLEKFEKLLQEAFSS